MSMQEYVQKKADFDRATQQRAAIVKFYSEVSQAMHRNADLFHFANCENGFPPEVIMNRSAPTINADHWHTAKQIQAVFSNWHRAKLAAENAWRALTQDEQKAMQPPVPFYRP